MGCDIHMFPERREPWGWRFIYRYAPTSDWSRDRYPSPDRDNYFAWEDRWYWFFGQLAGVRHDGPPIAEPRGVPEDADSDVKTYVSERGDHTHSWLTLAELQAHPWDERHDGTLSAGDLKQVKDWLARLAEIDPNPENVRIVFAFDN